MKNETKKSDEIVLNPFQTNIKEVAFETLKTLKLLEKSFGMNSVLNILRGDSASDWMKKEHRELETFGVFENEPWENLKNTLFYLIDEGFILTGKGMSCLLDITEKGSAFLEAPEDLIISKGKLKTGKFSGMLIYRLKDFRREESDKNNTPIYRILSNFSIEQIARKMPQTEKELMEIPGIGNFTVSKYGKKILEHCTRTLESKLEESEQKMRKAVKTPTYQEAKVLFEKGTSIPDIAKKKGVSERTIRAYLERLHICGEINMKAWIEDQVNSKELFKGAEYFKQVENPKMKEAYELLGLDYDVLRLCKLYVSDHSSRYEVVSV